jgi:hypothetical protein
MKNLFFTKAAKMVLSLIAAAILLAALSSAVWAVERSTHEITEFYDVPESHWAYLHINLLTKKGAITGYPEGNFDPSRNITRAEFLAVVVGALLDGRPEAPPSSEHWAANIINAAEKNNLLEAGGFIRSDWDLPITREEMAMIMARGAQYVLKEPAEGKTSVYTAKIADYSAIDENFKPYVAQVYAKGIVTGYPDGSFGGWRQATRAEAATMVVRLIDKSYRRAFRVESEITFSAAVDVAPDGRMRKAKAEEYMMKNLQNLKFYEENGKVYFEGYVTEVPDGFFNRINITVVFEQGAGITMASYSTDTTKTDFKLPELGPFREEIKGGVFSQIRYIEIATSINALKHTNIFFGSYSYEVAWILSSDNDDRIDVINFIRSHIETQELYDLSKIFTWLE